MGQPQLISTKSMPLAYSLPRISAVGTIVEGLFPASWTPKMDSEGCRRTSDHSSREEARKEVARPTSAHQKLGKEETPDTYFPHMLYRHRGRRIVAGTAGTVFKGEFKTKGITHQVSDSCERCQILRKLRTCRTRITTTISHRFSPSNAASSFQRNAQVRQGCRFDLTCRQSALLRSRQSAEGLVVQGLPGLVCPRLGRPVVFRLVSH